MKKGKSTKKKLEPFEIGELDQYLFGRATIMRSMKRWAPIRWSIKGRKEFILQYGLRMHAE